MNAAFWCRHKFDSQWLNAHRTTNKIKTFNNNNNLRVWTTKFIRSAYLSNAIIIISFLKWKRQAKERKKERNSSSGWVPTNSKHLKVLVLRYQAICRHIKWRHARQGEALTHTVYEYVKKLLAKRHVKSRRTSHWARNYLLCQPRLFAAPRKTGGRVRRKPAIDYVSSRLNG